MDAGGSPQAETRWSDPIALHQGSAGVGTFWLQTIPCRLTTLGEMVMPSCPPPVTAMGWGPGSSIQVWLNLHTEPCAGGGACGRGTGSVHLQMFASSRESRPQPSRGQKQPSLLQGGSPGPSTAVGRRRVRAQWRPESVRATGSGRLPSAGPREASVEESPGRRNCMCEGQNVWCWDAWETGRRSWG